jgi:hypothetical protein
VLVMALILGVAKVVTALAAVTAAAEASATEHEVQAVP